VAHGLAGAVLFGSTSLLVSAKVGWAAGFGIDYEGARAVGTASAGGAAAADATTIFYNPAGLVFLDRSQIIAGGQLFLLRDQFQNQGSTILGGALSTPGTNGPNAISPTAVPWFYGTYRINPDLSVGLGVYAPFGLRTDYGPFWVGRYEAEVSALTAINFNPSIAYRPAPWIALGAGPDVQYVSIRLTSAIDFGSACLAALGAGLCDGAFGLQPGHSDAQADLVGESVGVGFNLGVLVEPMAGTRVGVAYRSPISQSFGRISESFVVPAEVRAFLAAGGAPVALTGGNASASLRFPARVSLALKQTISEDLDLLLDANVTLWSTLQSVTITAANPAIGVSTVIPFNYRNAWRLAGALEYRLPESWSLRGGVAWDQTPIPLSAVQASLPDRDRLYLSAGLSYRVNDCLSLDLGYSHITYLGGRVPINRTTSNGDTLRGAFGVGGNIVAAQFKLEY
jgi:long-chain fatty acid transport protein